MGLLLIANVPPKCQPPSLFLRIKSANELLNGRGIRKIEKNLDRIPLLSELIAERVHSNLGSSTCTERKSLGLSGEAELEEHITFDGGPKSE